MNTLQICYPAIGIVLAIIIFAILFIKLCVDAGDDKKYAEWILASIGILAAIAGLVVTYFGIASAFC